MRAPALLACLLLATCGAGADYVPRQGDILFHTSRSAQSVAIQKATGSPYSHMGIVYVRAVEPALIDMPRIYEFLAQFRTETAAAVLASCLESELLDTGAILEIRGSEVAIDGAVIRDALLAGTGIRPDSKKRGKSERE